MHEPGSAVHDLGVVAEMHPFGSQRMDPPYRLAPGRDVAGLTGGQLVAAGFGVLPRRVGGIADQQVERAVPAADHGALVTLGVPGRGDHLQAGQHLRVPVDQLEPRVGEVEPVVELRRLAPHPAQLGALHVKGRMPEHRVLAAVVEVQVGVDHQPDIGGAHVVLGERVRDRKNTKYRFTMCNAENSKGQLILAIKDEANKLILSSFDKKPGKIYPYVDFECQKSGIYQISYDFTDGQPGSGVGVVSMIK